MQDKKRLFDECDDESNQQEIERHVKSIESCELNDLIGMLIIRPWNVDIYWCPYSGQYDVGQLDGSGPNGSGDSIEEAMIDYFNEMAEWSSTSVFNGINKAHHYVNADLIEFRRKEKEKRKNE